MSATPDGQCPKCGTKLSAAVHWKATLTSADPKADLQIDIERVQLREVPA